MGRKDKQRDGRSVRVCRQIATGAVVAIAALLFLRQNLHRNHSDRVNAEVHMSSQFSEEPFSTRGWPWTYSLCENSPMVSSERIIAVYYVSLFGDVVFACFSVVVVGWVTWYHVFPRLTLHHWSLRALCIWMTGIGIAFGLLVRQYRTESRISEALSVLDALHGTEYLAPAWIRNLVGEPLTKALALTQPVGIEVDFPTEQAGLNALHIVASDCADDLIVDVRLDESAQQLARFQLRRVNAQAKAKNSLRYLAGCSGLNRLSLAYNGCPISFEYLRGLRELEFLTVWVSDDYNRSFTPVTDIDLPWLTASNSLEVLGMNCTAVSNAGLGSLSTLSQLRSLSIAGGYITDDGLRQLCDMPSLEVLVIDGNPLSGPGLRVLSALPRLRRLSLENTRIDNEGLEYVSEIRQLRSLSLRGTRITECGLVYLKGMPALESLDVSDTDVRGLDAFVGPGFRSLTELRALNTLLSDDDVDSLRRTRPGLAVSYEPRAQQIGAFLRDLRLVRDGKTDTLHMPKQVSDEDFVRLRGLKSLKTLIIHGAHVSDAGWRCIETLEGLESLDVLNVHDLGDGSWLSRLPRLSSLGFAGSQIGQDVLSNCGSLSLLEDIDISDTQTTLSDVVSLPAFTSVKLVVVDPNQLGAEPELLRRFDGKEVMVKSAFPYYVPENWPELRRGFRSKYPNVSWTFPLDCGDWGLNRGDPKH
jgi:Leucine-rich repeat (LRR) protein